ncbi:MAG: small multi-drug export protein [Oscillospiraceae bacterium]|nr:small multi-drug export protein [Oscillospiraceae bacterium]
MIDIVLAFLISMLPILELRGGIIFAAAREIPFLAAFLVCFAGNIIPIPFILFFIRKIFNFLGKFKYTKKLVVKLENRARAKSDKVRKHQLLGLFLLVAIPLPGTGAWTGSLVAAFLNLPPKKAFLTITLGVLGAGIIMSLLFYLAPDLYKTLIVRH